MNPSQIKDCAIGGNCDKLCEGAIQFDWPSPETHGDADYVRGIYWNFSEMLHLDVYKGTIEMREDTAKKVADSAKPTVSTNGTAARRLRQYETERKLAAGIDNLALLTVKVTDTGYTLSMFNASPRLAPVMMNNIWNSTNRKLAASYKANAYLNKILFLASCSCIIAITLLF